MEKPIHYCNVAQIEGISLNDFRIALGVVKDMATPDLKEDIDLYIVTSPQHFKALTELFNQSLQTYEQIFGKINLEPNTEKLSALNVVQQVV